MGLFLFIDLTLQLSVYPTLTAFALVLDPVLDDPGQMLQQPQAAQGRRPIPVAVDALEKLGCIDIPLISRVGQIGNGFFHVLLHLPAIQEQLAKLILSKSIPLIRCPGKPI